MHEFGLCEGVVDAVRQRAGGRRVTGVRVRFGVRHAVDEESLAQAFAMVAEGTEAAGAAVELVTVPATALATSVLLVGYSVAAHGFSIRSRIRSLTVLDQGSHSAVTMARLALFAGVAPARGMQFSPETAVYPVFPPTTEPGVTGMADW